MFRRSAGIIATDLKHELILVDSRTGQIFSLNDTGRRVWLALPAGSTDPLVDLLRSDFDVGPEQAQADVASLIGELQHAGLITGGEDSRI